MKLYRYVQVAVMVVSCKALLMGSYASIVPDAQVLHDF